MMKINPKIKNLIKIALAEDIGKGDITSNLIIPQNRTVEAEIIAKEKGVVCGVEIAGMVFAIVGAEYIQPVQNIKFIPEIRDGARVKPGTVIAKLRGPARKILSGERVALNFLQRLSGISTLTNNFVNNIKGANAKILDTRKTTPGMREIEKYAVKCGGGINHRMGLYDAILIKDNHIEIAGDIPAAVSRAKRAGKVEIEAKNISQVKDSLKAGADRILLDNMNIKTMKQSVKTIKEWNKKSGKKVQIEASGGIGLGNVREVAKTGVDFISVGAVTHSAKALDISLEII